MEGRKMIDYLEIAVEYHGRRNDGFMTDAPVSVNLSSDACIIVKYDAANFRWIANRPSRIKYPKARQVLKEIRKKYAKNNA
jgi:hypothetical protein